ncbi:putative F-box protein At5g55150 [Corylus avellana]|uniref:putative F-box protein At5g55150 n=1 Tax=Corylus avellana TaxID=13451 RepID=UPI00286B647F|nr:putative F-box protein At5g55150 [Corylus avellana]
MELKRVFVADDSLLQRKLGKGRLTELTAKEESQLEGQLAKLPQDLINEIGKRLINYADYVRLQSTCKSLKSMLPKMPNHQFSQVPWLMLPHDNVSENTRFNFLNPLENKMYNLDIPEVKGMLLRGSSYGWILAVDGYPKLCLINPFTRAQIQLPPLDTFPDVLSFDPNMPNKEYLINKERSYLRSQKTHSRGVAYFRKVFVNKVVLSSNPVSNEYTAIAIYGEFEELAFCRSGDKKWSRLNIPGYGDDVMSHEGKFYVLNISKGVWIGDATSLPKMTRIAPPQHTPNACWLVRMTSGELAFVNIRFEWKPLVDDPKGREYYKTTHFVVYKLDQRRLKWNEVTSIGDDAFFIGKNNSLSVSSQNLPNGWRKNCIYFSDAYTEGHIDGIVGGYDNIVYNLETRRIESIPGYVVSDSLLVSPAPIWVIPNPSI